MIIKSPDILKVWFKDNLYSKQELNYTEDNLYSNSVDHPPLTIDSGESQQH